MNNNILILIDDVHLEGRPDEMREEFFNSINNRINAIKEEKDFPILVAAGDIGEGNMGVEWLKKFDCEIIYVTGNHEYWLHDIMTVDKNIEKYIYDNNLTNIHFLNNKSIVINGMRFIGGTLWTSLGAFFPWIDRNQIIKYFGAMGDFKKIQAKNWYTSENTSKIIKFLSANGVEENKINDLIENKYFNPLIEIEKHNETVEYFIQELSEQFDGPTIVVSHHMPSYESWMKKFGVSNDYTKGEWVNNEKYLLESAKGNVPPSKDIVMLSFYANDLKDLMYGELAPVYWLHGHLHLGIDDMIGRTKIVSSPVGYFKQNKEIRFKEINVKKDKKFVTSILRKEIESFDWANTFLSNLRILEKTINKFDISISMGIMVAMDFEPLLMASQKIHDFNMKELEKKLLEWLSLLYYAENIDENRILDLYFVKKKVGFYEMKIKFPESLKGTVNQYSFLVEEKFKIANKAELKNCHYKEWLKDIQKLQIQIIQFKKALLDFLDEYENK